MGTHSYQEAIRESINDLSNKGITTLTYRVEDEDGNLVGIRNYDIEGTVRRDILTSTRKLSNDINKEICDELNPEYIKISEHEACRPTHFPWQGTIIKYEDLVSVTGYGDVAGLGGINCKHYFEPYFGSARGDDLKKVSEAEATEKYRLSQQQRYLERGVRKWKRKQEMFKANEDVESYAKSKDKTLEWQKRLQDFTKENNLKRDFTREYVKDESKYINSEHEKQNKIAMSGKVNWEIINSEEYKNKINHLTKNDSVNSSIYSVSNKILKHRDNSLREDLYLLDGTNGEILGKQTNMVRNETIEYNKSLDKALKEKQNIIVIHNHPKGMPPSLEDINSCFKHKYKMGIIVGHDGKVFTYNTKKMTKAIDKREYNIAIEKYTKICYNNVYEGQLEAMKQLSKLYNFDMKEVL